MILAGEKVMLSLFIITSYRNLCYIITQTFNKFALESKLHDFNYVFSRLNYSNDNMLYYHSINYIS